MIERPAAGERAVIVQLDFGQFDIEDQVEEVRLLAESAGAVVLAEVRGKRQSPDPKTFAGKGKVDEIAAALAAAGADLAIFNHELSPALSCGFPYQPERRRTFRHRKTERRERRQHSRELRHRCQQLARHYSVPNAGPA